MEVAAIVGIGAGVVGLTYGVRCYYELRKWARMCQQTRITIAYKTKVKMDHPLTDFLIWGNQLKKDKASTGQVFYSLGGTSVALIKPIKTKKVKSGG